MNTYGTIFKITPSGTFTVIHHMALGDGANPHAHLILASDGLFYGTTSRGGSFGYGTIFKVTSAGVLTVLRSLNNVPDGGYCYGGLVEATDGYFYGITYQGGTTNGPGTIFKINSTGSSYTVLHNMVIATDGGQSLSDLIQASDGKLYGTAYWGGTNNLGTIFKITTAGSFSVIRNMAVADGTHPNSALVQGTDGLLYGLGSENGDHGYGSAFKITTAGAFTKLYSFNAGTDGGTPKGSLIQGTDGNFYGMTSMLGSSTNGGTVLHGTGTIFKVSSTGTFSVLTRFNGGIDGNGPLETLLQSPVDNAYYGTTSTGGAFDYGTVFKLCGGTYTVLHSFDRAPDGATPKGSLVMGTDSNFYGMTSDGGPHGVGTIFKITPTGTYSVLRSLTFNTDGQNPEGSLVLGGDGFLYGMTAAGGANGSGTIFKINQTGTSFAVLRALTSATDGAYPRGDLIRVDTNFYGMTSSVGHIFRIGATGSFTSLHTFSGNDGNTAAGSLVLASDGNFYGMASGGGLNSNGTIFKMTSAGVYTVLRPLVLATDGASPKGNLLQGSDGNLYGMTSTGGAKGGGTLFKITTGGTYNVLYNFDLLVDGGNPLGSLIKLVNNLVANPQSVTLKEDTTKKITLTGSGGAPLVFTVTVKPKHGSVSGTGAVKTYKPKANFNGKDSFAFIVSVGCLSSPPAEVKITVTAVPDTPVLAPIGNKTVVKNTLLTFTATATDADKGDKLTFSLIGAPAGANIDSVTGVFNWTPTTSGTYKFKVRVTDNSPQKLYDEEQITVTVTNSTPQADAVSIKTMPGKLLDATLVPNPVADRFIVSLDIPVDQIKATITDLKGLALKQINVQMPVQQKFEVDVSDLKPGAYFLRLQSNDGNKILRFVKL